MQKDTKKIMDINHETAMRLWNKQFGKATKVNDFTGRVIVKGAYNQRGSEYGWNVDHILPQSQGGKTADYNLICCHIKTNDEKANKFPCFVANNKKFEIIKVENHYEIKPVNKLSKQEKVIDDCSINLFDSAAGIRYFKKLKGIQNKPRFVGSIMVKLRNVDNTALIDFIENFFDEENISYTMDKNFWNTETRLIACNYNMPLKEDVSKLLDKCILLNTYLGYYFKEVGYIDSYDVYYQVNYYQDKQNMYVESQKINFKSVINNQLNNTLYINKLVYINTEAEQKEPELTFGYNNEYAQYNYIFTKLAENLKKEASGK